MLCTYGTGLGTFQGILYIMYPSIMFVIFSVSYKFGLLAMMSGIIGVPLGSMLAQRLRPRYPRADPVICAVGLLTSAPLVYCSLLAAASSYTGLCYTLIFLAELFLNMNWSIVADVLLVSEWMVAPCT